MIINILYVILSVFNLFEKSAFFKQKSANRHYGNFLTKNRQNADKSALLAEKKNERNQKKRKEK